MSHPICVSFHRLAVLFLAMAFVPSSRGLADPLDNDSLARGAEIYRQACAECHGQAGQGVAGTFDKSLVGDLSVHQLARQIAATMPEGEPEQCIGDDAQAVAAYIHHAFYSEAAQIRRRPPRQLLSRLTAEQLRQSLADLYAGSRELPRVHTSAQGLTGEYFKSTQRAAEHRVLQRVDPVIDFDFGRASPGAEMPAEDYSIEWRGGLKIDASGHYEIIIRSTCSFVCHLGAPRRVLIDNHVQSGDRTEFRQQLYLVGGRIYPFSLTFVQRKRKTETPPARISVSWVPPGAAERLIPPSQWLPESFPAVFALQTALPPDDRSYGFERGISVDRDWDESTTAAALEFAQIAIDELWPEYRRRQRREADEDRQKLIYFLREMVDVAFRYPLDEELTEMLVDQQVAREADDHEAIRRVLLLTLKSPRFLYPLADSHHPPAAQAATRLALTLMDSLPVDSRLQALMQQSEAVEESQLRELAHYLLADYRARAKVRAMLHDWLNLTPDTRGLKSSHSYPDFDAQLAADLRDSLDAQLDSIVWSPASDFRQLLVADWGWTTPRMTGYYGDAWAPAPSEQFEHAKPEESPTDATTTPAAAIDSVVEQPHDAAVDNPPIPEAEYLGLQRTASHSLRAGLLNHPLMTSRLAYHDATSPIHRGVFLLRHMLGRTLQPPQDAFSPLSPDLHPDLTTRQRVELQTSPESCQSCHARINSLGFALENWDADGRFREVERGQSIDPSASYVSRDGDEVQFQGAVALAQYLAASPDAHQAFVRRAFQFMVKQPPAAFGEETLERLTTRFRESDFNIQQLLVEMAVIAAMPEQSAVVDR